MARLCDQIEEYIARRLDAGGDALEIQRGDLAVQFSCAPSQINYVLETRFTVERGYVVESRRGGGGFIRIIRLKVDDRQGLFQLLRQIGERMSQDAAFHVIDRLSDSGLLAAREARLMRAVLHRGAIGLDAHTRDVVRARLVKAMLVALLRG